MIKPTDLTVTEELNDSDLFMVTHETGVTEALTSETLFKNGSKTISLTRAEYNALPEVRQDTFYVITDEQVEGSKVDQTYDPTSENAVSGVALNGALTNVVTISNLMSNTMKVYDSKDMNTIGKAIGYFTNCTNSPCGYGMGISLDFGNDMVQLIIRVDPTTPVMFIRAKANNYWGSWRQI